MSLSPEIWALLVGAVAAIAGLFGFGASQRAKGRQQAKDAAAEARIKDMRKAREERDDVQGMDDRRVSDELAKWMRDGDD